MLYSLPINSYTLVNDKENKIYFVKLVSSKKNTFDENDENYLNFVNNQNTNTRKSILPILWSITKLQVSSSIKPKNYW